VVVELMVVDVGASRVVRLRTVIGMQPSGI